MKKMIVKNVRMVAFDGEEIIGGALVEDQTSFTKMRTARLEMTGELEGVTGDTQILFTRKKESAGEFAALVDMIGKKGELEGEFTNVRSFEIINGKKKKIPQRVDLKLTANDGTAAFKFKAFPAPKWAEKYGNCGAEMVNFGSKAEDREKFKKMKQEARAEDDSVMI